MHATILVHFRYIMCSLFGSSGSVQVFGRTGQRSTQTFDSGGTLLDGGYLAFHSSLHVGKHSSAVSHHKRSHCGCFGRHVLKVLPYLHLTLWLLRDMCYTERVSLPQSVRQWWGKLECLHQRSTSSVRRSGQVGVLRGCTKQCHICS